LESKADLIYCDRGDRGHRRCFVRAAFLKDQTTDSKDNGREKILLAFFYLSHTSTVGSTVGSVLKTEPPVW